jgi:hypothetical protein
VVLRHGGRRDERLVVAAVRVIKADRSTASRDQGQSFLRSSAAMRRLVMVRDNGKKVRRYRGSFTGTLVVVVDIEFL